MKKQSVPTVLRISVLASAVSAILTPALPVQAQEPAEEILVTGSRIVRRDFEANSPILTLDSERFEESSSVAIEAVVNQLPQFVPSVGSFSTGVAMGTGSAGGFNDQIATGATRTPSQATLSMRGLGPNRNLVLLDGRRAMPINASMAVSINTIPSAAIARIETITGGASSVYGADAVAGVVNFITKRDFEGIDFDLQYGQTEEFSDAEEFRFSGVIGANFSDGRGNVLLGFERSERDEVLRSTRPYILDAFANPRSSTFGAFWGAAGYSPVNANMHSLDALNQVFGPGVFTQGTRNRQFYMNSDGTLYTETADAANRYTGPTNYPGTDIPWRKFDAIQNQWRENLHEANVQSPLSRYSLFGRAHIDISDSISAFAQVMYSESDTRTSADYSPMLGGWRASAPHGNEIYAPSVDVNGNTRIDYLAGGRHGLNCPPVGGCTKSQAFPTPPELSILLDSRPNPEADWEFRQLTKYSGLRRSAVAVTSHQIVSGLQGSLMDDDWSWELYGSTGSTRTLNQYGGVHSLERYRLIMRSPNYGRGFIYQGNPLGAGFASDFIECTSGLGGAYGVSGYTEFFEPSQDCQEALQANGKVSGHMTQNVVEFNLQGGIVEMPAGQLRFAVGAGMRDNEYVFSNDVLNTPESVTDQLGGFFPAGDSGGKTEVREVYGELLVPLLADKPGFESLNLELGYRRTDNQPASDIDSYKFLIDWGVVDRVRLRGGRQIANRAPNIGELFQASEQLAPFTVVQGDPCSDLNPAFLDYTANPNRNPTYAAQVRQLCETLMGPEGAASFYSDPGRPATLQSPRIANLSGSTSLTPEHAETITFGAVIDVTPNSTLTIDYWNIKIKDMIAAQTGDQIYRQCLRWDTNPTFDPMHPFCQQVRRNPATGTTASTDISFTNQSRVDLAGWDLQFDWGRDLGPGALSVSFLGSFLDKYLGQEVNTAATFDYKGTSGPTAISGVTRYPFDYRTFTTVGYRVGNWSASLRHRYLPSLKHEANVITGLYLWEPTGSYQVFDGTMRYTVNESMEVRFGIDNLLDEDPEKMFREIGRYDNDNVTNPGLYDVIGRRFYVGMKMTF